MTVELIRGEEISGEKWRTFWRTSRARMIVVVKLHSNPTTEHEIRDLSGHRNTSIATALRLS